MPESSASRSSQQASKQNYTIFNPKARYLSTIKGSIKHMDMIENQVFIVYHAPQINLDVQDLKGRLVYSFDMQEILEKFWPKAIKLVSLDLVQIPLLKWTSRRNKLLRAFGKSKSVFDVPRLVIVGTLVHEGQTKRCIMVLNLVNREIEKLKILALA